MKIEKPAVKYDFLATSDPAYADATAQLEKETTSASIEQAEAGYLPTGSVGNDEYKAFKYSYYPNVEAAAKGDKLDIKSFSSNDFAKFEAEIKKQDDLGHDLVSSSFSDGADGEGTWNALFGKTDRNVVYYSSDDAEEFEDLLKDAKTDDRNLSLLDIDYGAETWMATYSDLADKYAEVDKVDSKGYETNQTFDKLTGQIDTTLDKGDLSLVDIEYGDGLWMARYDSNTNLDKPLESTYYSSKDYETFQTEVETQKDEGYDLMDVEYIKGAWYGVFNESFADPDYQSSFTAHSGYDVAEIEASEII